ncbi:ABC transporter ATP-binding protein [Nocardioides panacisoli]|uniref:ABC transporter ATP-binding protein n=1 Tax=Nocardioides panacisoli TaxID=627624 RepID=UPI001F33E169|nr:ABC transporter ATP-binding protein [Nocardioides panacisoli]
MNLLSPSAPDSTLLEIKDLRVGFHTPRGEVRAVDGVSFSVAPGEILGLVGESGSGKSVLGRAVMGLVGTDARTTVTGSVRLGGRDVHALDDRQRRRLWGPEIAMIFQDPMTSLNPVKRIGTHLTETLRRHERCSRRQAVERASELLRQVGIPEPRRRLDQYPHELSGGMRQRVMIAIALACDPRLLIADEPTTALDVTVQRQILDLLGRLVRERHMAMILISHDLGTVAGRTDWVQVMYAGGIVETGPTRAVFGQPDHPYTEALLASIPRLQDPPHTLLRTIDGTPPDLMAPPEGCRFAPRCGSCDEQCRTEAPLLQVGVMPQRQVACHHRRLDPTVSTPPVSVSGGGLHGR